jgi:hypothetical protein
MARRSEGHPSRRPTWIDELRNGFAFALFAAVYALLASWLLGLPSGASSLWVSFAAGYGLAVLVYVGAHGLGWLALGMLGSRRRDGILPLAAPLASLLACAAALPRLFQPRDTAAFVQTAAFLGAGMAFSTARGFYAGLQQRLVPARRVRDLLARRPTLGAWLLHRIRVLLAVGPFIPWLFGALVFFALPPALRATIGARWLLVAYLAHLLNRKLLEELSVWVFLHALRSGDYRTAGQLSIRPARLATEIQSAPPDLEVPFARFIAYGMAGAEGMKLPPGALARLVPVYLSVYGLSLPEAAADLGDRESGLSDVRSGRTTGEYPPGPGGLVRRLLECGLRFRIETEPSTAPEPLPLPRWSELKRRQERARLAALYPDEPLWQVITRLYEAPIRALLLPLALLWLPLLGVSLALVEAGAWALPLVGAALSFALLLWLTLVYGNWIFDQSLRRRDFAFLARQLGSGRLRGELEDALGHRDPRVPERAVELLLFDDDIARLGITVPPAGLRKFRERAG